MQRWVRPRPRDTRGEDASLQSTTAPGRRGGDRAQSSNCGHGAVFPRRSPLPRAGVAPIFPAPIGPRTPSAARRRSRSARTRTRSTGSTRSTRSTREAAKLPFSLKILLENLLRTEDGVTVDAERHRGRREVGRRRPSRARRSRSRPSRVLLQDFTGVPCVVDLAAMRDAMKRMGGDPTQDQPAPARRARHRPLGAGRRVRHARPRSSRTPSSSSSATRSATASSAGARTRSQLQGRAAGHRHRPPGEPRVPRARRHDRDRAGPAPLAYPDTLVGTDSHTTMINGLGVLGWGVGGIEAEAAMLGQPVSRCSSRRSSASSSSGKLRRGRDRDRPRPHRHADAPQEGRRRQVRRVLRPRPRAAAARRPRDHRQHGARVRRDLRHLPGRRRDAPLPALHRPHRRAARARRGVLRRSRGSVRRRSTPEAIYTDTLDARPRHRRAEPRRPGAPAGPRERPRREDVVRDGDRRVPGARQGAEEEEPRRRRRAMPSTPAEEAAAKDVHERHRSSSPRSRAARTRRTRRC